jgi:hypothetical protein
MVTTSSDADRAHYLLMLRTLVTIASSGEGKSVAEYTRLVGVSKSVMSRYLLDMGPCTRRGTPGLGLVEARKISVDQATLHAVYLTPKGWERLRMILQAFKDDDEAGDPRHSDGRLINYDKLTQDDLDDI